MKLSFTALVLALVVSTARAAEKAEFSTRIDVVSCSKKSGCTGVDKSQKNKSHIVEFKEIKKKDKNSVYTADITTKHVAHGETYFGVVNILKSRIAENWIYTVTAYLKNSAGTQSVIRTRDLSQLSAIVLNAKVRKKGKRKVKATFYFGPARTDLF